MSTPKHAADVTSLPIDAQSAAAVASQGLRLALVDTADATAFEAWIRADARGFHGAELSAERVAQYQAGVGYRRTTAVYDEGPVATANSWIAELTVPGERTIDAWAISSVTVAPTHRRRGIARSLLEAELRTAAAAGVPLAILTVSESTIYGRFGFAPGAFAASLSIDTRRVRWTGPEAPGRLRFISVEQFRELVPRLHDDTRLASAGQIDVWGMRWDELTGPANTDAERTKQLRAVQYEGADGSVQGAVLYRVTGGDDDFTTHTLNVERLSATSAEASAALWRYVLEVDLVNRVTADMRPVDDSVLWQVSDMRGITTREQDHLWLRILDVPATLGSRRYFADGSFVLDVSDPLGFTAGRWAVTVADGIATVTAVDDLPAASESDGAARLALTINDLSAIFLGGVASSTLVAAGRVTELTPGAAGKLDTVFGTPVAPWLSVWF